MKRFNESSGDDLSLRGEQLGNHLDNFTLKSTFSKLYDVSSYFNFPLN